MKNTNKFLYGFIKFIFALVVFAGAAQAAIYTVTNTNDSGANSLRQAIIAANNVAGADTINFNIAGGGVHSIVLATSLPAITDGITINGTTQPGYAGNPLVEIVGNSNINGSGLHISYGAAIIRGLGIRDFDLHGIAVYCLDDQLCQTKRPSLVLTGSRIGTNTTGTVVFGSDFGNLNGVYMDDSAKSSQIGGTGANDKNVISGNRGSGIKLDGSLPFGETLLIVNNMIGTNLAGTAAISNQEHGIWSEFNNVTIGGDSTAERNIISGNALNGIFLDGYQVVVEGNYIGTNAAGTAGIPNGDAGIMLGDSDNVRIGGLLLGTGNVISGNGGNGIHAPSGASVLFGGSPSPADTLIYANRIGTNAAGTAALPNGASGINIIGTNTVIGLAGNANSANIIAGNAEHGIRFSDEIFDTITGDDYSYSTGVKIQSNYIGTNSAGADLGNGGTGILLDGKVDEALIGGSNVATNVIAFNDQHGIELKDRGMYYPPNSVDYARRPRNAQINANSIYESVSKGIKIYSADADGADALDADTGSNNLQNMPVLTNAYAGLITGTFHGAANTTFNLDFYSSPACDASGRGEGKTYLNSMPVTTDANGNAYFETNFSGAGGTFVTATATLPNDAAQFEINGTTSEFSNCVAQQSSLISKFKFSSATYTANENAGTAAVSVQRLFGGSQSVTVDYATSNGTATAGQDYAATSGTLTFNQGESTKTINVPITNDTLDEVNETVNLTLSNPSSGAVLFSPASAVLTVTDDDAPPTISINDISLAEGNEATTAFTFTVALSSASGSPVAVNFQTASGTANSGLDFQTASGTINFSEQETSKQVTVSIYGELTVETNETFFVNLSNPVYASIADAQGKATILDDDNPGKFSFVLAPYTVAENGGMVTATVTRTNGTAGTVSVDYATGGGTATAMSDYTPASGSLVFADGETTKTFTVNLLDDAAVEPTETFNVILSNPIGGASLGAPSVATVNILDNDSGTLHTIGGEIKKPDNSPLAGATVNLTGAQTQTATTDAQGKFNFANLAPNGNYAITPQAIGYTFNPIYRRFNNLSNDVANANFTATPAPSRQLRIVGGNAAPTQNVAATVELVAQGDENSVGFSLNFDPQILTNPSAVLAADAAGANLIVNDSQAGGGKLGIVLAMPAGTSFAAGTRSLVTVTFNTLPTQAYNSPLTFGSIPVGKQIVNSNADPLPTDYLDGAVTFAQGYEADVTPRPTGKNNGAIMVTDFTQVGRFVAGLDQPNANYNEFQRADSAPRITLGNGALDIADFTQAGRYAAGLDAVTLSGGQLAPRILEFDPKGKLTIESLAALRNENSFADNPDSAPTVVRVVDAPASAGQQIFVTIAADAQGTENGFGFTLNYDATKLSNPIVSSGADTQTAILIPNLQQAGKVGVVLAMPFGQSMASGAREVVKIRFDVAPGAASGTTPLTFGDAPVIKAVSDVNANTLQSTFENGAINILGPTAGTVSLSGSVTVNGKRPLTGAQISITGADGETRSALVAPTGRYRFDDLTAGETYVVSVTQKGVVFAQPTIVVTLMEDTENVNFAGN